jgi:hypothetical protein
MVCSALLSVFLQSICEHMPSKKQMVPQKLMAKQTNKTPKKQQNKTTLNKQKSHSHFIYLRILWVSWHVGW